MLPHIEEARQALRLADRDIAAFETLRKDSDIHLSIICFHAQQGIEKSLKAVLFSRQKEFRRTHDLVELSNIVRQCGLVLPVSDDSLLRLTPFAVSFRYDEMDYESVSVSEVADCLTAVRSWAETQVSEAEK